MSETDLSRSIAKALEALGYPIVRIHSGKVRVARGFMQLAAEGTPDRLVLLRGGRVIWIEVKFGKGGVLSAKQLAWHARAAKMGHYVITVRSVREAIEAVRAADKEAA